MSNGEILHITKDEKFIDGADYLFEKAFPGRNRFVVLKPAADPPIRFLSNKLVAKAECKIISQPTIEELAELSSHYSVTVLHGVSKYHAAIFSLAKFKNRFLGIVHGAEIHNSGLMDLKLMGDKTKALYQNTSRETLMDRVKNILRKIKYCNHTYPKEVDYVEMIYQMQVFGSLPGVSYQRYIDKKIYNPSVQHIPFSYYPIDFIISDESLKVCGNDILLGNSASVTNNHLEAFDLLKSIDLADRKIISPLSYGCERYARAIASQGKKIFGNTFVPLTKFLPISKYNELKSNCGIVIMNHYRPEAIGNIIASLYMGAKVFLNDTEAYQYFKKLGCFIYLIQEELQDQQAFDVLSDDQVQHNRYILNKYLGTPYLVEEMQHAFERVFDFNIDIDQEVLS